jgi:hypothetical protein
MNVLERNWSGINYSAKDRWSHGKMRSIIIRETESERNNLKGLISKKMLKKNWLLTKHNHV